MGDPKMPARLESTRRAEEMLGTDIDAMTAIVEHHGRGHIPTDAPMGRKMKQRVAVVVWEEPDGTETVCIVSDTDLTNLEMKGILHDGIYALAHDASLVK